MLAMFIKFFGALVELLSPIFWRPFWMTWCPPGSRRGILLTGGAMVLCAALCVNTANIVANRMSAISAGKITLVLRHDLFQRLDRLLRPAAGRADLPSAVSPSHQ